jgi:hypothetical protein
MSGEQSFSISSSSATDAYTRKAPERQPPSDRDVAEFERALRGGDRAVKDKDSSQQESLQDIDRKRLQATTEAAVMMNAPNAQPGATASAPGMTGAAPAQLDELIAQYVKMFAISEPTAAGDLRVMLTLDQSILPQTELFLSRAPEGWVLQANTRSPEAFRIMSEYGPALERRFALRGLGALSIEATMLPSAVQGV